MMNDWFDAPPLQVKARPWQLRFSADGQRFSLTASDRVVRVFNFLTGKLYRAYDESLARYSEKQAVSEQLKEIAIC